jgi:Ca2+-binding RTX toxin-like protein
MCAPSLRERLGAAKHWGSKVTQQFIDTDTTISSPMSWNVADTIYEIRGAVFGVNPSFTNNSTISMTASDGNVDAFFDNDSLYIRTGGLILNATGADITVSATGAGHDADLYMEGVGQATSFTNNGTVQVASAADSAGLAIPSLLSDTSFAFSNTGSFTVSGDTSAVGVWVDGGGFENSGNITASSSDGAAIGVQFFLHPSSFSNTGTIQATDANHAGVGVLLSGPNWYSMLAYYLNNTGNIIGDDSIKADFHTGDIEIVNSGTLTGAVDLSASAGVDTVINTGTIVGDVLLADRAASFSNSGSGVVEGVVHGGAGADTLTGGAGNDVFEGGAGNDTIDGGAGTDTAAYSGAVSAYAVTHSGAVITVSGPDGTDTLTNVEKLQFTDATITLPGGTYLNGTAGNDSLNGDSTDNLILGGAGGDTLYGGAGNDAIYGGDGNDFIDGGPGNDVIDGGAGWNVLYYGSAPSAVNVNLSLSGVAQDTGGAGIDTISNIQALYGSAYSDTLTGGASDTAIYGGAGDDTIRGGAGNDNLFGGAGNDYMDGGPGHDVIDGGAGSNIVSYQSATAFVKIDLNLLGTIQDTQGAGYDTLSNFENVMGSSYNDTLIGDAANNNLYGMDGNDTLYGGAGDDSLLGGNGNDYIDGGPGNDVIDGGAGFNIVAYGSATHFVKIDLNMQGVWQDTQGAGNDLISNVENVIGSSYNDTLIGDAQANVLYGGAGDDTLYGGAGNDNLFGGAGNDYLDGGSGNDVIDGGAGFNILSYGSATSAVTVNLSLQGSAQDTQGAGVDTISNVENLIGSGFNDTLTGDGQTNVIYGGAGDDVIAGGGGGDKLFGGAGNNTFVYTALSDSLQASADQIQDFAPGDKLDVSAIDADTGTGGDQAFHLGGGGGHSGDIVVTYDAVHNKTLLDFYVDNTATIAMEIVLLGDHSGIAAGDFVL